MGASLAGASPGEATEVRCRHCQDRVYLVAADRGAARTAIAMHLIRQHNVGPMILEGTDFLCGPAPHRCDLCMSIAEPPWWTYITPSTPDYPVEDPGWLVCEPCHQVIQAPMSTSGPLEMLVERSLREQMASLILDNLTVEEVREHLRGVLRGFLDNLAGEPERS